MQENINWQLARLCAELSDRAYTDPDKFKAYLFKRVIMHTELKYFEKDGAQAYGIHMPDFTLIIFRGTEVSDLNDVLADIQAWSTKSDTQGEIHYGFKNEIDKLYPDITRWLGSVKSKKLVVTGHSLGAAIASIFAAREHNRGADVTLYTYGSPYVGNETWAEQFNDIPAYRFVNTNDIVCKVPPFGYTHVGELCYLSYNGTVMQNMSWYTLLKDGIKGRLRAWSKKQIFSGIYDHSMSRYIKKITKQ